MYFANKIENDPSLYNTSYNITKTLVLPYFIQIVMTITKKILKMEITSGIKRIFRIGFYPMLKVHKVWQYCCRGSIYCLFS